MLRRETPQRTEGCLRLKGNGRPLRPVCCRCWRWSRAQTGLQVPECCRRRTRRRCSPARRLLWHGERGENERERVWKIEKKKKKKQENMVDMGMKRKWEWRWVWKWKQRHSVCEVLGERGKTVLCILEIATESEGSDTVLSRLNARVDRDVLCWTRFLRLRLKN